MKKKYFKLGLPETVAEDKVSRRLLRIVINDGEPILQHLPADATESKGLPVPATEPGLETTIRGQLTDFDAAGNESEPEVFSHVVDVTAPRKPGAVSLMVYDFEEEEEVSPTTTVAPTTTPLSTSSERPTTTELPSTSGGEVDTTTDPVDVEVEEPVVTDPDPVDVVSTTEADQTAVEPVDPVEPPTDENL